VAHDRRDLTLQALEADVDEEEGDQHAEDRAVEDQVRAAADPEEAGHGDGEGGTGDGRGGGDPQERPAEGGATVHDPPCRGGDRRGEQDRRHDESDGLEVRHRTHLPTK